jgi:ribosomal protein S18 acetylase RimI-like enzyme
VDARLLDEIAAAATVSPIEEDLGGWWCKAAPDLPFRRCNVALPADAAGLDRAAFDEVLPIVRRWYHERGRRLIVQVSSASPGSEQLDGWLAGEGLDVEAPVHILVAGSAPGDRPGRDPAGERVAVTAGIDGAWAAAYGDVHGGDATQRARTAAYGRMLAAFGDRALGASCAIDGRIVGVGFGVLDRGWMGVFGMGTSPEHRRQRIATSIVDALRAAAASLGADRAYLQVETDNPAAIALYEGLGFARSHGYHYRSEPERVPTAP